MIADSDVEASRFNYGIYCALSDPERRDQALSRAEWDLTTTDGAPGFSRAFVTGWNDRCHPFVWTKTSTEVLNKANRSTTSKTDH